MASRGLEALRGVYLWLCCHQRILLLFLFLLLQFLLLLRLWVPHCLMPSGALFEAAVVFTSQKLAAVAYAANVSAAVPWD